jgi:hypothetical protein
MSNYHGVGRTNYFRVKDPELFKNDLINNYGGIDISSEERISESDPSITETWFCLFDDNSDGCGWGIYKINEDDEEEVPERVELIDILPQYLVDTDVAVIVEAGSEKYIYLVGVASAVNSKGQTVSISIDDIYGQARTLGSVITHASF